MQWLDEMGERGKAILEDPEAAFGAQVKQLRLIKGWSQRELAAHLHEQAGITLDASAITRIEGGRSITLRQAVAIAYTLDAESLDFMLEEPQEPDPEMWLEEMRSSAAELKRRVNELRVQAEIGDRVLAARLDEIEELEENLARGRAEGAAIQREWEEAQRG